MRRRIVRVLLLPRVLHSELWKHAARHAHEGTPPLPCCRAARRLRAEAPRGQPEVLRAAEVHFKHDALVLCIVEGVYDRVLRLVAEQEDVVRDFFGHAGHLEDYLCVMKKKKKPFLVFTEPLELWECECAVSLKYISLGYSNSGFSSVYVIIYCTCV